jgi:hypothetical protein
LVFLVVCTASLAGSLRIFGSGFFGGTGETLVVVFFGASVESFFWRFQWPVGFMGIS